MGVRNFSCDYVRMYLPAHTTAAVPGSVLGGSRMGHSGGSVDDTMIASLIWDSPSHPAPHDPASTSGLQKSPLHKSTSALTDLQDVPMTTSTLGAHVNYQGHPHLAPHNSREYHNRSTSYRPPEDMFSPPPLTPVSAGLAAPPRNHGGLPEFDLTDEIFQHFSGRSRRDVTPPTTARHDYHLSPRQTSGPELRTHFPLPPHFSSSPIKRTSSPDIGTRHLHGDQRARSNSPDMYLPTPEHYHYRQQQQQQQPTAHSYSNSYHSGGTPSRNAHSNPPSRPGSGSKGNYRSGMTGANPQSAVTSPPWYDGTGMSHQHHQQHHTHHHKPHTESTNRTSHREEGGAYRQGQQHQHSSTKPAAVPMPRRRNEETAEIQEFLHDLAKRETNPFNDGGTLV